MTDIRVCCLHGKTAVFDSAHKLPVMAEDDRGRRISLVGYRPGAWPTRRLERTLRKAQRERCVMAAVPDADFPLPPDCGLPIARGRWLKLAMLPQIFTRAYPDWQQEWVGLCVSDAYSCTAALRLSAKTNRLALYGPCAKRLSAYLYERCGLAVVHGRGSLPVTLNDAALSPPAVRWRDQTLPLPWAEAVLTCTQPPPLFCDLPYLEQLGKRAGQCGFTL